MSNITRSQSSSQSFTAEMTAAIETAISKHMTSFTSTITALTSEIAALKASLQQKDTRITELQERIDQHVERIDQLEAAAGEPQGERVEQLELQLDALEQYGRRLNIRVDNVPQLADESIPALEKKVLELLNDAGAPIKTADVVRLHRIGQLRHNPRNAADAPKCSQVMVRLNNWRAREAAHLARNAARTKGHAIRQDLTRPRREVIAEANDAIRSWGPSDEPVYCYANINCEVTMRRGRETKRINCDADLRHAIRFFKPRN